MIRRNVVAPIVSSLAKTHSGRMMRRASFSRTTTTQSMSLSTWTTNVCCGDQRHHDRFTLGVRAVVLRTSASSSPPRQVRAIATTTTTRLMGTQRGIPGNPPGTVTVYNDQTSLDDIDEEALVETVRRISRLLGYETYDVTLLLVDDEEMRETNLETRGVDRPTDILSFPFHFAQKPGLLQEPEFDIPDYYTLGDMMVCVPYVQRRCQEDLEDSTEAIADHEDDDSVDDNDDDGEMNEQEEEEEEGVDGCDRGVSGAMANIRDPEQRIRMLLVHGMLHLVGYDHEEDEEYEEMVEREEAILREMGDI